MALVKPIVEVDGEYQRLQPSDSLDVGADTYSRVFTSNAAPGQPVYAISNTNVELAQANASATSELVGVTKASVVAGNSGTVVHDGILQLTTIQWDAVTGESGGLTLGAKYFVSNATAGELLVQGNLTGIGIGEYVVPVGKAISDTQLLIYKDQRTQR